MALSRTEAGPRSHGCFRLPLPLVPFYLLPAFKENLGWGWGVRFFRWVRQGSLFLLKSSVQSISHS